MGINISASALFISNSKMPEEEVLKKLDEHEKWRADRKTGCRAVFVGVSLEGFDFHGRDLTMASFIGTYFGKANFSGATLSRVKMVDVSAGEADFSGAKLDGAMMIESSILHSNFEGADLSEVTATNSTLWDNNMKGADLTEANFAFSDIADSDFYGATAEGANFTYANLDYVRFSGANCKNALFTGSANTKWADFSGADLTGAIFTDTGLAPKDLADAVGAYLPASCPEEGPFVAWIKGRGEKIVKLLIPEDAERGVLSGRLSYADKAEVLAVYDKDGKETDEATDLVKESLVYRTGSTVEKVKTDKSDYLLWFYISRKEAENIKGRPDKKDAKGKEDERGEDES